MMMILVNNTHHKSMIAVMLSIGDYQGYSDQPV